jgi:hypothetical protein
MSMSLDGFIAGPNEGPDNGLGDGGQRLHEWCLMRADADLKGIAGRLAGVNGQVVDEFMSTGAVVAGRGTFEPAGGWGGDHHDGVPIFVLTWSTAPEPRSSRLLPASSTRSRSISSRCRSAKGAVASTTSVRSTSSWSASGSSRGPVSPTCATGSGAERRVPCEPARV